MVRPFVLCEPGKLMLTSGFRSYFTFVAVVGRFFSEVHSLSVVEGLQWTKGGCAFFSL